LGKNVYTKKAAIFLKRGYMKNITIGTVIIATILCVPSIMAGNVDSLDGLANFKDLSSYVNTISTTNTLINKSRVDSNYFSDPCDGYTLFAPEFTKNTYLIDINGEIVHGWESDYIQGIAVYLLENGNLVRNNLPGINPTFGTTGGINGRVEVFDWNGTLIWEYEYFTSEYCLHHDIEVLPNGNILMIAWEYKTRAEAIAAGRNPNNIPAGELWPDHIIEVKPTGSSGGDIIWEWHVWDHLIQNYDSTKDNYGIVEDHPELIDINFGGRQADWNHINSIDYHEEFDQILLSSHNQNEIWIIDHSTTSAEAAGHTGGKYGKGGDLLYRWGNPQVYDTGGRVDQKLYGQHDAQWIESGCPGEGNILVFNNGMGRGYSSVDEIIPPVDSSGNYVLSSGLAYGPEEQTWVYTAENPTDFFADKISGAQRLPNGNTLICNGPSGLFFEVTPQKEIVWEYANPFSVMGKKNVFKIHRYPTDYPGLKALSDRPNKPSTPSGPISGKIGIEHIYTANTTDPNGDPLYYWFDWGDGTNSGWLGPYESGDGGSSSHVWDEKGIYEIRVKAKDTHGLESDWSDPLSTSMTKNKVLTPLLQRFLERYPNLFPILRNLLGMDK
jgi:hypothetical protein